MSEPYTSTSCDNETPQVALAFIYLLSLIGLILLVVTLSMGSYNLVKYVFEASRYSKRGGILITLFYLLGILDLIIKAF